MKVEQNLPTLYFPDKMVNFGGAKGVAPPLLTQMRNCKKKLERIYLYTIAYTQIRDRGGRSAPPLTLDRVNN